MVLLWYPPENIQKHVDNPSIADNFPRETVGFRQLFLDGRSDGHPSRYSLSKLDGQMVILKIVTDYPATNPLEFIPHVQAA